jgi:hypothetical protein
MNQNDSSKIYLFACCFNEGKLLPFFLDYYFNFIGVEQIFLFDGGSTDNTYELIKDYPVQLIIQKADKLDDRELMNFRNEYYKQYRNECDWVIVCDIDEFLFHPNIETLLKTYKSHEVTLPLVVGYEMLSKSFPAFTPKDFLPNFIQIGSPNPSYYNKHLVFDPIIDINYLLGCHNAQPSGPVKYSSGADLKNLHYKILSLDYFHGKAVLMRDRLSDWNKKTGAGFHYEQHAKETKDKFLTFFIDADNVFEPVNELINNDPIAFHISKYLLSIDEGLCFLDISNYGRYPSNFNKSLELLKTKFGSRHIKLDRLNTTLDINGITSISNLNANYNLVYIDISLLLIVNLEYSDSVNLFLALIIAKLKNRHLLVIFDLSLVNEFKRSEIINSKFLLEHFKLIRHENLIFAEFISALTPETQIRDTP